MLLRRDEVNPPSESLNVYPIRHLEHLRHVVADEDHRQTTVTDAPDELENLAGLPHAQCRGRLVHDDELACERGGPGHGHTLALTTGKLLDRVRHRPQTNLEFAHLLRGLTLHRRFVEHPQHAAKRSATAYLTTEEHVTGDIQRRRHGKILVDSLDPVRAGISRAVKTDRVAIEQKLAQVRRHRAGQRFDQGRFSRSIVPDDGKHLAGPQLEVAAVQRGDVTVPFDQATCLEDDVLPTSLRGLVRRDTHWFLLRAIWSMETAAITSMPVIKTW